MRLSMLIFAFSLLQIALISLSLFSSRMPNKLSTESSIIFMTSSEMNSFYIDNEVRPLRPSISYKNDLNRHAKINKYKHSSYMKGTNPVKTSTFYLGSRQRYITIDSDFDSGNIKVIKKISDFQFSLQCQNDGVNHNKQVNSKSWFYFKAKGFPTRTKAKFIISRLQALSSIYYSKYQRCYRPVYRVKGKKWMRMPTQVLLEANQNGCISCTIEFIFSDQDQQVQFAFSYPYTFEKNRTFMKELQQYQNNQQIYFHKEVFIKSPEGRDINLLTISSCQNIDSQTKHELVFNEKLFPQSNRPLRFKKPVVFMTARVHPGQTSASFAMEGAIEFLLDKRDLRAELLRKMFVFMVVPMINVDGVYHGHFRMDIYGKNLNRFYIDPNPKNQTAIYAIKQLSKHLISENRLCFYFDFHGHNAKKGSFIYGNAMGDFVEQVESQVFCKLFAMNHAGFEYQSCNFSQRHMTAKDRFEQLTKEGCGRVVMYRTAKIFHSYSLQCGILSANNRAVIPQAPNQQFILDGKGFENQEIQSNVSTGQRSEDNQIFFTEASYHNLGKNLLVTILDSYDKNPYNRIYNSKFKSIEVLRRLTAFETFHSFQRFRMFEKFVFQKVKNINSLILELFNSKLNLKKLEDIYFNTDKNLVNAQWPKNIIGLSKPFKLQQITPTKIKKFTSLLSDRVNQQKSIVITDNQNEQTVQHYQRSRLIQQNAEEHNSQKSSQTDDENDNSNHEIFEICDNQREQGELIKKFMGNDICQKDIQQLQEKMNIKFSVKKQDNQKKNHEKFSSQKLREYLSHKQANISKKRVPLHTDFYKTKMSSQESHTPHEKNYENSKEVPEFSAAEEFRKNIYETIKQEIRSGLRKEFQKKKHYENKARKFAEHFRFTDKISPQKRRRMRSKVRLPSLGSNMYIVTTSTRIIKK